MMHALTYVNIRADVDERASIQRYISGRNGLSKKYLIRRVSGQLRKIEWVGSFMTDTVEDGVHSMIERSNDSQWEHHQD